MRVLRLNGELISFVLRISNAVERQHSRIFIAAALHRDLSHGPKDLRVLLRCPNKLIVNFAAVQFGDRMIDGDHREAAPWKPSCELLTRRESKANSTATIDVL